MVAIDAADTVPSGNELGGLLPRLGERDELALVVEQRIAADVRELPHEAPADETDPNLRRHALPVGDRAAWMLEDRQLVRRVGVGAAELDVELDAPAGRVRQIEVSVPEHERLAQEPARPVRRIAADLERNEVWRSHADMG